MSYPHRIRLRGPWECEPLARLERPCDDPIFGPFEPLPPALRMNLPRRWGEGGLGDFAGRVRFTRRFGYPGRIDAHERVWLTFAGVEGLAEVRLNGRFLGEHDGACGPFEHEVTALLSPRNELAVEVEAEGGHGGLWGEVAMEVRCTAYLRDVRAWVTAEGDGTVLHAAGEVVGTCGRPLELYLLIDNRTAGYATAEAAPEGRAFELASEALGAGGWGPGAHVVRVDLVQGASIWYTFEREFEFDV